MVVAFENGIGFYALYAVDNASFAALQPMIDYTFSTITVAE
jgi:hypothetical protein